MTNAPGGPFTDPITGKLWIEYDAASTGAPLSGTARLWLGRIDNTLSQMALGVLTITGTSNNALSPGPGGTPGTLAGANLNLAAVANHTVSGFLHCYDLTGPLGPCDTFFGTPASNPIPQTGTGPFPLPAFGFTSGSAGIGDFTSAVSTQTPQTGVTIMTTYVGREISRTWVPEPTSVAMLVPGALLVAGLAARRRRA